jgi:hypothetical protein
MNSTRVRSRFFTSLKISVGIALASAAFNARAEYYFVYPDPGYVTCGDCCTRCVRPCYYRHCTGVVYIESHSPRRYHDGGGMAEYAWIPTPEAP